MKCPKCGSEIHLGKEKDAVCKFCGTKVSAENQKTNAQKSKYIKDDGKIVSKYFKEKSNTYEEDDELEKVDETSKEEEKVDSENNRNSKDKGQNAINDQPIKRKSTKESASSKVVVNTSNQISDFIKYNKPMVKKASIILTSVISLFLVLIIIFSNVYTKNKASLEQAQDEKNYQQLLLEAENEKYYKDVLKNADIYRKLNLSPEVYAKVNKMLFSYEARISFNNSITVYKAKKNGERINYVTPTNGTVTIYLYENYTESARRYLDVETIRLFSRFIGGNIGNNWYLKDYRTFLTLGDMHNYQYYLNGDETQISNVTVTGYVNEINNLYKIEIRNFNVLNEVIPEISLELNHDLVNSNAKEMTTSEDIIPQASSTDYPFKHVLAEGTKSQTDFLLDILKENSENDDNINMELFEDSTNVGKYTSNYTLKVIDEAIEILKDFTKNEDHYYDKGLSEEEKYYLSLLKDMSSAKKYSSFAEEYYRNIFSRFTAEDSALTAQAKTLLETVFGKSFTLNNEEKILARELRDIDVDTSTGLTTAQEALVDKILNMYEAESIYEMRLTLYKAKSSLLSTDFSTKLGYSRIDMYRGIA